MMEWYAPVLDRLDKLRQSGANKWTACCPVHDDSNPSMSVTVTDTPEGQKLLFYCFSCGAKGDSVIESIGLKVGDLFEQSKDFTPDRNYLLNKSVEDDDFYILIYDTDKSKGKKIRYKDHKEYVAAMARRELRTAAGIPQTIIEIEKDGFL
jgi:DNA primase|tara:strand:- start:2300 stop:2752 length:453 start_codon:yes stop_codon:yes gene_type:complete